MELSNGRPEALYELSYMLKRMKSTIIQLEIVMSIIIIHVGTYIFSDVSARIWNVITTNINVNISFM